MAHEDFIPQRLMFELGFWPGAPTLYERGPADYPLQWLMFANTRTPMKLYIKFDPTGDMWQRAVEYG